MSLSWLRHPLRAARARLAAWWLARLPATDRLLLTQRNVYILPTRAGLLLALTLAVLLVASINYQLSLGYLLTFLLAGCALAAMHLGHGTLRGLTLQLQTPDPVFAGSRAQLVLQLVNTRHHARRAIGVAVDGALTPVYCDVGAQACASVQLAWPASRRGWQALPALRAQTRFPLGTFHVWTLWRPAAQLLVYPKPEHRPPPLPVDLQAGGDGAQSAVAASAEFDGVRPYRRGDALKSIVWKKVAQTGELVSRDSQARRQRELWLAPEVTGLHQLEPQLSRLCAWVLAAEAQGLRYGLRLNGQRIGPDQGTGHQQRCLRALALA